MNIKVIVKRFDCLYRISPRYSQFFFVQTLDLSPNCRYTKSRVGQKNSNNSQNLRTDEGIPMLYLSVPISTEAAYFVNSTEIVIFFLLLDLLSLMFTLTLKIYSIK